MDLESVKSNLSLVINENTWNNDFVDQVFNWIRWCGCLLDSDKRCLLAWRRSKHADHCPMKLTKNHLILLIMDAHQCLFDILFSTTVEKTSQTYHLQLKCSKVKTTHNHESWSATFLVTPSFENPCRCCCWRLLPKETLMNDKNDHEVHPSIKQIPSRYVWCDKKVSRRRSHPHCCIMIVANLERQVVITSVSF